MVNMTKTQALEELQDGHAIWKPEHAKAICEALGVSYTTKLECTYKNEGGLGANLYGNADKAVGVDDVTLARYIANALQAESNAQMFIGQGRQARAYVEGIKTKLAIA